MRVRTRATAILGSLALLVVCSAGGQQAVAADDATPPVPTALSVSPTSVDTSSSPATVTVSATIVDDVSGVGSATIDFVSPSSSAHATGSFSHVSGDNYSTTLSFPQGAESGLWVVNSLYTDDNAGNAHPSRAQNCKGSASTRRSTSRPRRLSSA